MTGVCQYSVEVKSRFSLFWDDSLNNEDPELLLMKLQNDRKCKSKKGASDEQAPEPEKVETPATKQTSAKVDKPALPEKISEPSDQHADMTKRSQPPFRGRGGPRGYVRNYRGSRGAGPRAVPVEQQADQSSEVNDKKESPQGFRGRFRGRGRPFRGTRQPYTDYRQFDEGQQRNSRQHAAGEAKNENKDEAVVTPDGDVTQEESPKAENQAQEAVKTDEAVEEKPKTLTLEEYKALKMGSKPVTIGSKETRKPNDGKDVFANMVPHRKVVEESDEEVIEVGKEPQPERTVDIDVTFTDRVPTHFNGPFNRGRGGRGRIDRGGARGGRGNFRGRGTARGGAHETHVAPPVIYNDQEFPSLS